MSATDDLFRELIRDDVSDDDIMFVIRQGANVNARWNDGGCYSADACC